jgi:hypothetical protein
MGKRPAIFLAISFVTSLVEFPIWMVGKVAWVDFLHHNPNRSQANALLMVLLSPLYGLVDTLLLAALPLIAALS